jgi:hypothetical protein
MIYEKKSAIKSDNKKCIDKNKHDVNLKKGRLDAPGVRK